MSMSRRSTWVVPPDAAPQEGDMAIASSTAAPRDVAKQMFARALWRLMVGKAWNQSELARRAELGRDVISSYIRAQSLPTPANAQKLADALGVKITDLYPGALEHGMQQETPAVELRQAIGDPTKAWLRINMEIPYARALKILALLQEGQDDAP